MLKFKEKPYLCTRNNLSLTGSHSSIVYISHRIIQLKKLNMKMVRIYRKPAIKVVQLQHHSHLLAGSPGVKSISSTDGFILNDGGLGNSDADV